MIKFKKLPFTVDQVYLGSDFHLGHKNICKSTSKWEPNDQCRDFNSLYEMDTTIINNINSKVGENDLLIHLGDFNFQGEEFTESFRERFICKNIVYIAGNHDFETQIGKDYWYDSGHLKYYQIDSLKLVLSHYPIFNFLYQNHGSLMCHGHLHSNECKNLKDYHDKYKILDCGIDNYKKLFGSYNVFSLREINTLLKNKNTCERH